MAETTTAARRDRPRRLVGLYGSSVMLVFGLLFLVPFFIVPVWRLIAAQRWTTVACTILESEVRHHNGGRDTTYSVAVRYSYEAGGATRVGTRYSLMGGSDSGYGGKQKIVDGLPPGRSVTCYVNPRDPEDAVMARVPTAALGFGLFPLLFVALALYLGWRALHDRPQTETEFARVAAALPADDGAAPSALPRTLRQSPSPAARFAGMLVFALLWNGLVALFVVGPVGEWRRGEVPVLATLFLLPFVGVGLYSIGRAGQYLLMLWNPRARLTLSPGMLAPGHEATVEWTLTGNAERIKTLAVTLEGREQATYVRGTDRHTDTEVFARIPAGPARTLGGARQGMARLEVPAGAMHSFASNNNKIVWVIRVQGQIDHWPDMDEEYPVTVLPHRRESRA